MSAAEIIEMIEKLPPEEKARVFAFVEQAKQQRQGEREIQYLPQEEVERRAAKILRKTRNCFAGSRNEWRR